MCDNHYNFVSPWNNSFYYHYMQQHAAMSYHFQKLHSNIHYGTPFYDVHNLPNSYHSANAPVMETVYPYPNASHPVDYSSSSSSCCSCCSSGSCSKSSSSEYEEIEIDSEEGYEKQYEDGNYDEDESECEYEFNVDAILQMRAVKEELKKQELLESKRERSKDEESSESSDEESRKRKRSRDKKSAKSNGEESSDSKDGKESKSDSIVVVDSDKDDFEFIDLSGSKILECQLYKDVGGFHRTKDEENKRKMMEYVYGSEYIEILALEIDLKLIFEKYYDEYQPSLWPVLPLRL